MQAVQFTSACGLDAALPFIADAAQRAQIEALVEQYNTTAAWEARGHDGTADLNDGTPAEELIDRTATAQEIIDLLTTDATAPEWMDLLYGDTREDEWDDVEDSRPWNMEEVGEDEEEGS